MSYFYFSEKISPVLVASIHDGHYMREELRNITALSEDERMREEDPYTGYMAEVSDNRTTSKVSRFETDLNRLRDKAIYKKPEDAWGLNLWKEQPTAAMLEDSLKYYDAFYVSLRKHLQRMTPMEKWWYSIYIHTITKEMALMLNQQIPSKIQRSI